MGIGAAILIFAIFISSQDGAQLKHELKSEWQRPHSKFYLKLSGALAAACLLSLLNGYFFPVGYGGNFVEVQWLRDLPKLWYLFWPAFLVIGLRRLSPLQRRRVIVTWFIAFAALSAMGIFQYFTGWPRMQAIPGEPGHFHATLFLGHHLSVASIFIFPFFLCLDYGLFWQRKKIAAPSGRTSPTTVSRRKISSSAKTLPQRFSGAVPYFAFAALGFFTLFFTYSRTLWVSLPVGLFLWILLHLPKSWGRRYLFPILVAFFLAIVLLSQIPVIQKRLTNQMGIYPRQELWLAQIEFFKERPLTGVGWRHNHELSGFYLMEKNPGQRVFSGHAHNNFLDVLGSLGLMGSLTWLAWCAGVFWISATARKNRDPEFDFSRGLICAWVVFQINGLTQVNFWEGKVEHQMAWVIAWALL